MPGCLVLEQWRCACEQVAKYAVAKEYREIDEKMCPEAKLSRNAPLRQNALEGGLAKGQLQAWDARFERPGVGRHGEKQQQG